MSVQETFRPNHWPTLGVELEFQLVDQRTMGLKSAFADVFERTPRPMRDAVKPEFMQCYVELNTDVCRTVADVDADLTAKIRAVEGAADACGTRLFWAATHPFSRWRDQQITPDDRYYKLANLLQETVIRPVTFGMHVHVGVASGDVAMRVASRLQTHLPTLLALSANSPFWHGRPTGHHAHRIEVLEGFPSGGLPPHLNSWADYLDLVDQLRRAGFIESHRELWWDIRPNAENGTVEVRIFDMPPDLPSALALTALVQCLVTQLAGETEQSFTQPASNAVLIRQNRWRACRFGLGAALVDPATLEPVLAREAVERLVGRLRPIAHRLGCARELESVREMAARPTGSERQIALFEQTGDLAEVVRRCVEESRLGPPPSRPAIVAPLDRLTSPMGASPCSFLHSFD